MTKTCLLLVLALSLLPLHARQDQAASREEMDAYYSAVYTKAPEARAVAFEKFIQTYPHSEAVDSSLELLIGTYDALGDTDKERSTAQRMLDRNRRSLKGLATFAHLDGDEGERKADQHLVAMAAQYAHAGLEVLETDPPPQDFTPSQWKKLRAAYEVFFRDALGKYSMMQEDYPEAENQYKKMIEIDNGSADACRALAESELQQQPMVVAGFFWAARSIALRRENHWTGADEIAKWLRYKYVAYHGDEEGLDGLLHQAEINQTVPVGFNVIARRL